VFVWELNSQTTVAVENWPESTPVIVIVSARTLALAAANTNNAASEKTVLPNRDMWDSSLLDLERTLARRIRTFGSEMREVAGQLQFSPGVVWRDIKSVFTRGSTSTSHCDKISTALKRKHQTHLRWRKISMSHFIISERSFLI
jgi:hypothetical protein